MKIHQGDKFSIVHAALRVELDFIRITGGEASILIEPNAAITIELEPAAKPSGRREASVLRHIDPTGKME